MEALKNVAEWEEFVKEVGLLVVEELKEHAGDKWYLKLTAVITGVATKLRPELAAAIADSKEIPAEFKAATLTDWIEFAVDALIDTGSVLTKIFIK